MPQLLFITGCAIITSSCILFYKDKGKLSILFLIIGGLLLRIYVGLDFGLHTWDEQYHALVAKNMINDPFVPKLYPIPILEYDYKVWISNYIWLHKPPFALWVISASLKIFGFTEFAVRLPSIIFTSMSIYFVYGIGEFVKDKNVGYLSAFFFSINGFIIELASGRIATDHVDSVFTFLILLSIFLAIRLLNLSNNSYSIIVGTCLGMAILTKWVIAFFILPVIFLILVDFKIPFRQIFSRILKMTIIALIIAVPWSIYTFVYFTNEAFWENGYNIRHIFETLEDHQHSYLFYIDKIRICYHDAIYIPLIWFGITIYKQQINNKYLVLGIWAFVPLIFFSMVKTKMPGYLEFTAAAYFIIISLFWFSIQQNAALPKWQKFTILILLIALPIRYSIERIKPFSNRTCPQWINELKEVEKSNDANEVLVMLNFKKPIQAMFYTNMIVYDLFPTQEAIDSIREKGYKVILNLHGCPDLNKLQNVEKVFININ